jgi:hypothetical protein
MKKSVRRKVRERAGNRCEYCRLHEDDSPLAFHLEHVIAIKHGGSDRSRNLAWSCPDCNLKKGPNLSGWLRSTDEIVPLFNPRRQKWSRHFRWSGPYLRGRTKVGAATIVALNLNHEDRIVIRRLLIAAGEFPIE